MEIHNTYENDIAMQKDFDLLVPICFTDRKIDYSVILALLLRSNLNRDKDNYRYVDYSRLNKKEICEECKISIATLDNRMKYLQEKNIITAKNTSRGLVYNINYSKDAKYYVAISNSILKDLYYNTNKNVIKVYLMLVVQCEPLNNRISMSNAFLCSQLGYSTKAETNLTKIGQWTDSLARLGLIEKIKQRIYRINNEGKRVIMRIDTYYRINKIK